MPYDRTYYVLCGDDCRFEGMTKEQIIAAIAEATGATPTHIDDAFITKIKEQNKNAPIRFWIGTQAEYNALTPEENVFYIFSDGNELSDVEQLAETTAAAKSAELIAAEKSTDSPCYGNGATISSDLAQPQCVAIGAEAECLSDYTTAIGHWANASGQSATALGDGSEAAGFYAVSLGAHSEARGENSIAIGKNAFAYGDNNVALGVESFTSLPEANTIQLGDPSISALRCKVALTVTSDERDKADIVPISKSLDFIKSITPIQYVDNDRHGYLNDTEADKENLKKYGMCAYDKKAHKAGKKKGSRKRVGFSAQQITKALAEIYDTDNYANIVNDSFHDLTEQPRGIENQLTVAYQNIIPFLVGAVQEQQKIIEELRDKVAALGKAE